MVEFIKGKITRKVHIAPLIYFRIVFGLVMFASVVRFVLKGWVYDLYILPKVFFPYYGFEWVKPLNAQGMYFVFTLLGISALGIMAGGFYRICTITFFALFTYVELIDKTNYLNHYYFISIVSFLLIFLPGNRYFSIDSFRNSRIKIHSIPFWYIGALKLQLAIVYFYAGLAKLNYDWLINAMPLKIWLPPHTSLPVIGPLLDEVWVAYLFSWTGAIYDLLIPFLLLNNKTRIWSYLLLLVFHILTSILFPIGMFPYIMMGLTIIFFSEKSLIKIIDEVAAFLKISIPSKQESSGYSYNLFTRTTSVIFVLYFTFQILFPFRYLLYPGNLFWTEEGYRFSWRVMLMEKAGTAFFYVKEGDKGISSEICNSQYLTRSQEKMMSTQPDMILQYAKFLEQDFKNKGFEKPVITVESYVTLNGSGSRLFLDPKVDLTKLEDNFSHKNWILPFENK